jgi:hypothetical protein
MRFLRVFGALFLLIFSATAFSQSGDYIVIPSLEFKWYVPSLRENGEVLPLAEIGGYELRWRVKGAKSFRSIIIRGGSNKSYLLEGILNGLYECHIATFDADGLYSKFVPIKYKFVSVRKPNKSAAAKSTNCTFAAPCNVTLGAGDVYVRKD